MSNKDRILTTLASAKGPICDDCLSARAGVAPRQTVFQICSSLFASNKIRREQNVCRECGKLKKASQSREGGSPPAPDEPAPTDFQIRQQLADLAGPNPPHAINRSLDAYSGAFDHRFQSHPIRGAITGSARLAHANFFPGKRFSREP